MKQAVLLRTLGLGLKALGSLFFFASIAFPLNAKPKTQTPALNSLEAPYQNFEVRGKIAFKQGPRGGNVTVNWQQENTTYAIELYAPLGARAIYIDGSARGVSSYPIHVARIADDMARAVPDTGFEHAAVLADAPCDVAVEIDVRG